LEALEFWSFKNSKKKKMKNIIRAFYKKSLFLFWNKGSFGRVIKREA